MPKKPKKSDPLPNSTKEKADLAADLIPIFQKKYKKVISQADAMKAIDQSNSFDDLCKNLESKFKVKNAEDILDMFNL